MSFVCLCSNFMERVIFIVRQRLYKKSVHLTFCPSETDNMSKSCAFVDPPDFYSVSQTEVS